MIKKLDKLILKAFLGPFIVTFFIALFVLVMQTLWKYIDELVGKGLDVGTVLLFVWYASATLFTLAMPIAILISTIMTFGALGESFELVAIKSSGISLLRFMRPIMFIALLLCGITFLFANYLIPYSQLKFVTLYKDIKLKKPSLDMKPGSFYTTLENYSMRIADKNDTTNELKNVLIFEQTNPLVDNTIIADSGKITVTDDKNYMSLLLKNGNRYQERGNSFDTSTEYIRLKFKTLTKNFDLSAFNLPKTSEDEFKNADRMLSAKQLDVKLDSLIKNEDSLQKAQFRNMQSALYFINDTSKYWKRELAKNASLEFPDSAINVLNDRALAKANEIKNMLQYSTTDEERRREAIISHKLEWHKKFSISLACLVLFFIGAPLGSIIRKGGLGMPLVVAIIFFLIFHLLTVFGEKFVRSETVVPAFGMWLAIFVLTPVCFFLTYKALNDSQLFNKEFYFRAFASVKKILPKFSSRKAKTA
jgi:lipopolysaccharide export system permease protein